MIAVHVAVHVKTEYIEAFRNATMENARNSLQEPGVLRFDVLQQLDDPSRFMLVEVYRSEEDPVAHKQTAHYSTWRETVEEMMAGPRSSHKYVPIFPGELGWPGEFGTRDAIQTPNP